MSERRLRGYNWREIARVLGGSLVTSGEDEVRLYLPPTEANGWRGETLLVSENGGEVNVSVIVPRLTESVPYHDVRARRGHVSEWDLAVRLSAALRGLPFDPELCFDDPSDHATATTGPQENDR